VDASVVLVKGGRIRRRRHSEEFKTGVVAACRQPGVSIAAVALANGLNANLLRRWVAHSEAQNAGRAVPGAAPVVAADGVVPFVPLTVRDDDGRGAERSIRIEVQRGAGRVQVHWPLAAAAECAAWLRGWLK
jgi:transposase-like protein